MTIDRLLDILEYDKSKIDNKKSLQNEVSEEDLAKMLKCIIELLWVFKEEREKYHGVKKTEDIIDEMMRGV